MAERTRVLVSYASKMGSTQEMSAPVTFGGRLDVDHATGPVSRWMGAEGPLAGDFRDWDRIRAWATDIAR